MMFSASAASVVGGIVTGSRGHDVAGGQLEDVGAALHVPPQVAVGDDAERARPSSSTTQVMPSPLLDIS